jgi:hypothetical protein
MDELRIGSLGSFDSLAGQTKDGSKKRPRQPRVEPEDEPVDQVVLSSPDQTEDQIPGDVAPSRDEEGM